MKRITVLLVEDHAVVREGLRNLIELEDDFEVAGEAHSGREAVVQVKKLQPDVVLMDIAMPLLNGLEATRQMVKANPATKVLILSAYSDDAYVENATESGAMGFLLKHATANDVRLAIREVHKGRKFFSPVISRRQEHLRALARNRKGGFTKKAITLTTREVEVLQLIAEGMASKEIAAELGITMKTVEKHREHVMQKLDIHDIAGLTRYAIITGIIESSVRLTIV
jgi:DNA-binding NarL/FixJ family response regulator